jgi:hypothetical protein
LARCRLDNLIHALIGRHVDAVLVRQVLGQKSVRTPTSAFGLLYEMPRNEIFK